MKILSINSVPYGSTAKIMIGISNLANSVGFTSVTSTGYSTHPVNELPENNIDIGNAFDKLGHMTLSRLIGYNGCFSKMATMFFLNKVEKFKPDVIHIHNLHGWYINIQMLFKYIKTQNIPVVWTLHDCWSFTGHCPHFTIAHCNKWKDGCKDCSQYRKYPESLFDRSAIMWEKKKAWFTDVPNMTIVTPSKWLAELVTQSYLKEYNIKIINNGIDLSIFSPRNGEIRKKYNIPKEKKILLGVSFGWGYGKGLDVFVELAKRLDQNKYQIILVGTDEKTDSVLSENIISIHRTQNQKELAELYTTADLFVNPTREENYPTVNMEAIACGTPVLTFRTGGSPEMLNDMCGCVVECNDIDAMENEIMRICEETPFSVGMCLEQAKEFDMNARFEEYIALYDSLLQ